MSTETPPKALFFDTFGTVVDWRSSIHRALLKYSQCALGDPQRQLPPSVRERAAALTEDDWHVFAQQWRDGYTKFTTTYGSSNNNQQPFITIDEHHLQSLRSLLREWHLEGLLTEDETRGLALAWHKLGPWPDSTEGLTRLNQKFQTSTLSNGNRSLLQDLCDYGPLPFQHITSAEEFAAYKPSAAVYDGAVHKFGLRPAECAMVAAHLGDLKAARGRGYQTIYVERPQEEDFTDEEIERAKQEGWVDLWISQNMDGFRGVAAHFGL